MTEKLRITKVETYVYRSDGAVRVDRVHSTGMSTSGWDNDTSFALRHFVGLDIEEAVQELARWYGEMEGDERTLLFAVKTGWRQGRKSAEEAAEEFDD